MPYRNDEINRQQAEDIIGQLQDRILELEDEFYVHLRYLYDDYPDVYQDPAIPAFEDYLSF